MSNRFRLLLIEDDETRVERFTSWLPEDAFLVVARSPGRAIGTLRRDSRGVYAGVMLDHDLQQQSASSDEMTLSGSDLAALIIRTLHRDTAVLIHSMNAMRAPLMAETLDRAGFWVTRIPMDQITEVQFREWVEDVRSLWQDD